MADSASTQTAANDALLVAENLTVAYNGVPALHDFNLTVRPGDVTAVLGPNGAGKTTALLSLVGLLSATKGCVTALGQTVTPRLTAKLARQGIVLVPDDRGIFAELTVAEHFHIAGATSKERMKMVLDRFPALRGLTNRRAGLLSGGEQQLLAIAKALLVEPKVLMVDEMSLGLAPVIVQEMLPGIRDLAKDEGMAVVLVEQHVALALSVSDRALVLNQGRVVLDGNAAELAADPTMVEMAYFGS